MSSAQRAARDVAARQGAAPRQRSRQAAPPPLTVVPTRTARASSGTFAIFVGGVLALGLLGLLALNTLLAQGAFATSDLTRKQAALAQQEETLQQQVALLAAPQSLAAAATKLGMVGTKNPVFLDPVTGKIMGVPLAGAYPAPPAPTAAATPGAAGAPAAQPTGQPSTAPTGHGGTAPAAHATAHPTAHTTPHATPSPTKPGGAG